MMSSSEKIDCSQRPSLATKVVAVYSASGKIIVEMQAQDGTDRLNKLRAGTDED